MAQPIQPALDWLKAHPQMAEAKAVLICAWIEFDEEGYSWPHVPLTEPFQAGAYPALRLLSESTPAAFCQALAARAFVDSQPTSQGIFTFNGWNDWTEGSYLEPDFTWGWATWKQLARRSGHSAPARKDQVKGTIHQDQHPLTRNILYENGTGADWCFWDWPGGLLAAI